MICAMFLRKQTTCKLKNNPKKVFNHATIHPSISPHFFTSPLHPMCNIQNLHKTDNQILAIYQNKFLIQKQVAKSLPYQHGLFRENSFIMSMLLLVNITKTDGRVKLVYRKAYIDLLVQILLNFTKFFSDLSFKP